MKGLWTCGDSHCLRDGWKPEARRSSREAPNCVFYLKGHLLNREQMSSAAHAAHISSIHGHYFFSKTFLIGPGATGAPRRGSQHQIYIGSRYLSHVPKTPLETSHRADLPAPRTTNMDMFTTCPRLRKLL